MKTPGRTRRPGNLCSSLSARTNYLEMHELVPASSARQPRVSIVFVVVGLPLRMLCPPQAPLISYVVGCFVTVGGGSSIASLRGFHLPSVGFGLVRCTSVVQTIWLDTVGVVLAVVWVVITAYYS